MLRGGFITLLCLPFGLRFPLLARRFIFVNLSFNRVNLG